VLTISGERKFKNETKEEDYYKIETSFGKFSRTFTLPDDADIEHIEASSQDGVLEVVIPKLKKEENVRAIEVK
jgi:HSP20 family protein